MYHPCSKINFVPTASPPANLPSPSATTADNDSYDDDHREESSVHEVDSFSPLPASVYGSSTSVISGQGNGSVTASSTPNSEGRGGSGSGSTTTTTTAQNPKLDLLLPFVPRLVSWGLG